MQHKNFSYLKKTEDYRLVSRNSRSHKNKFFFFKISPHNITKNNYPDNKAILAITITKKIGNAVTSNKIKILFNFSNIINYSFVVKIFSRTPKPSTITVKNVK